MRLTRACSRHGSLTGQVAQIRRATSTPTPSLGKNVLGDSRAQLPLAIHSVSMCPPVPRGACSTHGEAVWFPGSPASPYRLLNGPGSCLNVNREPESPGSVTGAGGSRLARHVRGRPPSRTAPSARPRRLPGPGGAPLGGPVRLRRPPDHRRLPLAGDGPPGATAAARPAVPAQP